MSDVSTVDGSDNAVRLVLKRLGRLRLSVENDIGQPVHVDLVRLKKVVADPRVPRQSLGADIPVTATEKTITLGGLSCGTWSVDARDADGLSSTAQIVQIAERTTECRLVIPRPAMISGRFMSVEGREAAVVRLFALLNGIERAVGETLCDKDGSFVFEGLGAGTFSIKSYSGRRCLAMSDVLMLSAGEQRKGIVLGELLTGSLAG
jgi:hypothetical protein